MPVYQELVDYNSDFAALNPDEVIIINDLPNRTEEDRKYFDWLVKEQHTSDMVSMMPRCRCGELKGEARVGTGQICEICRSPVEQSIKDDIKSILWFRRPQGVEALIVPEVMIMLMNRFNKKGCNILKWLIDRSYVPLSRPAVLTKMMADGIPRGLNNFIRNFDAIFNYLMHTGEFDSKSHLHKTMKGMVGIPETQDPLDYFIKDHRHLIFCDYIPLLNRSLQVVESTEGMGRFVESHVVDMRNILNTMLSIDRDYHDRSQTVIENRTAKIMIMLCDYYENYVATNLRPKTGTYRKHVYGTRGNYSFRAVITSHSDISNYDSIHAPWGVGITVWWQHHMALLTRRGYKFGGMTHTEATNFLMDHVEKYNPILDEMLQDLIRNSRYGRIVTTIQRNPSLMQGSAETVFIDKFKPNPKDQTVSMNDLIATSMNA